MDMATGESDAFHIGSWIAVDSGELSTTIASASTVLSTTLHIAHTRSTPLNHPVRGAAT